MGGLEDLEIRLFEGGDLGWLDGIQMSSDAGVDDGNLIGGGHGHVLSLKIRTEIVERNSKEHFKKIFGRIHIDRKIVEISQCEYVQ